MATSHILYQRDLPNDLAEALVSFRSRLPLLEPTARTRANVSMITTHWEAVRALAEFLPLENRGFSFGIGSRNYTSGEILALAPGENDLPKQIIYSGYGVHSISIANLDLLIVAVGSLSADARRRTSLSLFVTGSRWRGSKTESTGSLSLSDSKGLGRKVRFRAAAVVTFASSIGRPIQLADLDAIKASTGLNFASGEAHTHLEQSPGQSTDLASASLAFGHAMTVIADDLRRSGFDWNTLKGVYPNGLGVKKRFEALMSPAPKAFRFETELNRFMKSAFPFLKKRLNIVYDGHAFMEKQDENWSLGVVFDTHPGIRVGKVFKLHCIIFSEDNSPLPFSCTAPMLLCSGGNFVQQRDWCPEFIYGTREEFDEILESLRAFMLDYMQRLRETFRSIFLPSLTDISAVMPVNGALTCRESLELARLFLASQNRGDTPLKSCHIAGTVGSGLHYRIDATAQMPPDGRLNPYFSWSFRFQADEETLVLFVPYAGAIRAGTISRSRRIISPPETAEFIPDDSAWMDSDEVAAIFFRAFDSIRERYPEFDGVVAPISLRVAHGRVLWVGRFELSSKVANQAWVLITHAVNADDGTRFSTHFDERFQNRPVSRSEFTEGGPPVTS
jgi:hypothetical protein